MEEQRQLGRLGLAGICREIYRVVRRAILPIFFPSSVSALLLADAALSCALPSRAARDLDATVFLHIVADSVPASLLDFVCVLLFLLCTAAYVRCFASLYRTGGDVRAANRFLQEDPPVVPITQLVYNCTFFLVEVPVFLVFSLLLVAPASMHRVGYKVILPLCLLGWSSAAYVAAVSQLAYVVSVLEDTALFGSVRRSRELLAGKFWAAACVFVTLDGCIIAVLKAFMLLVVNNALGLGLWFQVAAGAAMFVALRAVLVVTLVAQAVVYMVCKSHHQEVVDVDMAHLD